MAHVFLVGTATTGGALAQVPSPWGTESTCGATNDWQNVDAYDGTLAITQEFVQSQETPVGRIQWRSDLASRYTNPGNVSGNSVCTGTLISENLFLTAGHCFDVDGSGWTWPRVNGTSTAISSAQGAKEMVVNFNYQDANGSASSAGSRSVNVSISSLAEYRLGSLDYAIVKLSGMPINSWSAARVSDVNPAANSAVSIVQHPQGIPKVVHAGPVVSTSGSTLYHQVDTLGGSSGSGVLNQYGEVIAVHVQAGCNTGGNRAVLLSSIKGASPLIRTLLAPNQILAGDWFGDGTDNLAVRYANRVLMDFNADGVYDFVQTYGYTNGSDAYLVGDWNGDGRDNLAVRRGNEVIMDYNFDSTRDFAQAFGDAADVFVAGNWDGDARDNIAIRRGNTFYMETTFDWRHDIEQSFANTTDVFIIGDWDGDGRDNVGVRRGNLLLLETTFDWRHDIERSFGSSTDTFIFGDWDGNGTTDPAVIRSRTVLMSHDSDGFHDEERRW